MTEKIEEGEKNTEKRERKNISSTPVEEEKVPYNLEVQTTVSIDLYWSVIRHSYNGNDGLTIWFKSGNIMYVSDKYFVSWRSIVIV